MRIGEYKQIDTEVIKTPVLDEEGNETGEFTETQKPITGMVYRDMTPEEEEEMFRQQAEFEEYERNRPLTPEERMEVLEDAFAEFVMEVLSND